MPAAVLWSGAGRYADPWHRFNLTSPHLADLARGAGWDVTVANDIDRDLAGGLDGIDLVIVNAGNPWIGNMVDARPIPADAALVRAGRAALDRALRRGMSLLVMHCALVSVLDYPAYRVAVGGAWDPTQSWHPELTELAVHLPDHPITRGLRDFTVADERYTDLVIDAGIEPLARTAGEGAEVPLAWAYRQGPSRVIVDALGHDERSYDSPGHREFLARALSWLLPTPVDRPA